MRRLRAMWLEPLRVTSPRARAMQLDLLPGSAPAAKRATLETLDARARGTRFLALPVRSVLNSPATTGMSFWSLNPYVGCEFGCAYCYARDTHRYLEERLRGWIGGGEASEAPYDAFERRIFVKLDAAAILTKTLDPAKLAGHTLVIGTATDPYQPAERRFRLTRRILEALAGYRGLSIGLITKSPLIVRDLDVLTVLAARHDLSINVSLATIDARLARRLEPRSPVPRVRLRALRRLADAGIDVGILVAPIIPRLTDDRAGLDALFAAARAAGARYAIGGPLRLAPAARARFLPFLEREFPELAERYHRHYAHRHNADGQYLAALTRRLCAVQRKHGFPVEEGMRRRRELEDQALPEPPAAAAQPSLL